MLNIIVAPHDIDAKAEKITKKIDPKQAKIDKKKAKEKLASYKEDQE